MAKKSANTKVEAANARKASAKAVKVAQKAVKSEAETAEEWSKGSNARAEKRREEEERKQQEIAAKKAEKKRLEALEDHSLEEDKSSIRKLKAKEKKQPVKPWEEALISTVKKSNKGNRSITQVNETPKKMTQAMIQAARESEEKLQAKQPGKNDIQFAKESSTNLNRQVKVADEARSIDAALDVLSLSNEDAADRHPERRAKAAYKAFEEVTLPELKQDFPGLKLSQYKQKLSDMWRKSPQNPFNQERVPYNAKK
uniref:Uncharacterized protein AlNc14C378G11199 n=1 Tax=Albugo laibachii Nc14 TaxID=890382 RepID=F0WYD9_9STRA|nr:conserved hypothetical protein [Albugo laibachii Nc14]|eukprot:CCA26492.1 conserved hypothetical protein [Albugo laibachii Nc14]